MVGLDQGATFLELALGSVEVFLRFLLYSGSFEHGLASGVQAGL